MKINKERSPHLISTFFFCSTITAISFSLAAPFFPYQKNVFRRSGISLAVGIDISKSMLAEDVSFPFKDKDSFTILNRFNLSRLFAIDLLSELDGEDIGIFIFAGNGIELVPLTADYGYCRYILKHINDTDITLYGSHLGKAITTGVTMLDNHPGIAAKRIVIISDGEDMGNGQATYDEAAKLAVSKRIKIYTVGVGSPTGSLIPLRSSVSGPLSYYVDESQMPLKTRLNPGILETIAKITGGRYFDVKNSNAVKNLVRTFLDETRKVKETKHMEPAMFDLSPIFLLTGFLSFIAGVFKYP
ncbi:VWA domain-containing protein [Desulfobacterales bacterium HSG16]|nr:VWA domain-containing protein [Desulfobacterales bacterium HSG16]